MLISLLFFSSKASRHPCFHEIVRMLFYSFRKYYLNLTISVFPKSISRLKVSFSKKTSFCLFVYLFVLLEVAQQVALYACSDVSVESATPNLIENPAD